MFTADIYVLRRKYSGIPVEGFFILGQRKILLSIQGFGPNKLLSQIKALDLGAALKKNLSKNAFS